MDLYRLDSTKCIVRLPLYYPVHMAKNYTDKKAGEHWHATAAVLFELDEKVYSTVRILKKSSDQFENSPENWMPILKKDYISIEQ
jgi:hypothetical protein